MSSAPSRSSADAFDAAIEAAATRVLDAVGGATAPVVLIDGRSGAGKTSLAGRLAARWSGAVQVLALDDVYPGWDGLDAGVAEVLARVLAPRAAGARGSWRRWDWDAAGWAESHEVDAALPLVVEGSGILTPATAPLADLRVWLESPDAARKDRALARDGDRYRPHWDRWAAQERRHVRRDHPEALADLIFAIP